MRMKHNYNRENSCREIEAIKGWPAWPSRGICYGE